jgi:hypothetical protein
MGSNQLLRQQAPTPTPWRICQHSEHNGTLAYCHTLQLSPRWMAALKILYEHKDAHQKSRPLLSPAHQTPIPPVVPVPVQSLPARENGYREDESWTATVARAQVSARLSLFFLNRFRLVMCMELPPPLAYIPRSQDKRG